MIAIPKKGEVIELFLSAAAMQELGKIQGNTVKVSLPEATSQPYDDNWLECDGVYT